MVNCAIDKKLLRIKGLGAAEYLASKCKIKDKSEVMLILIKKYQYVLSPRISI